MDKISLLSLGRETQLRNELKILNQTCSNEYRIYSPNEGNLHLLKADLFGPEKTPYCGGVFTISIHIPNDYPFRSPVFRIETPMFHPNVSSGRRIIFQEFITERNWSPFFGIEKMIGDFARIFHEFRPRSVLNMKAASLWKSKKYDFDQIAAMWTRVYAASDKEMNRKLAFLWIGNKKECKILNRLSANLRVYIAREFI
jgi:ubiquitin-conjugating enzyme E2 D/E